METKNIYQKLFEVKKANISLQRDTKAFNYKYATLDQIQKKLWEELQKQWLIVIHTIIDNKVNTKIINVDKSEEYIESEIEMTTIKAQDKGSEITYFRRYNLLALLDLEVEDDDGKKAQDSKPKEYVNNNLEWIADSNIKALETLVNNWTVMTMADVRKKYKVSKKNAELLNNIWIK